MILWEVSDALSSPSLSHEPVEYFSMVDLSNENHSSNDDESHKRSIFEKIALSSTSLESDSD